MHKKLSHSPLSYVLAQVRFTNIESIEKYIPDLQELIRQDFPKFEPVTIRMMRLQKNGQVELGEGKQWNFIDKDQVCGVVLDSQSISFHTSQYGGFSNFFEKFKDILEKFNTLLSISLVERIGIRYINFITDGLDIENTKLIGFKAKGLNAAQEKNFIAKEETTQFTKHGVAIIKTVYIGDRSKVSGVNNIYVPPDLEAVSSRLSFAHKQIEAESFLILDIDHSQVLDKFEFDIKKICANMKELQNDSYTIFTQAVGTEALKKWT